MGLNVGYLKADRTKEGDEQYTPYYAARPILKYIPKDMQVWTPFDQEWSAFYQTFKAKGYSVVRSDQSDGLDFLLMNLRSMIVLYQIRHSPKKTRF